MLGRFGIMGSGPDEPYRWDLHAPTWMADVLPLHEPWNPSRPRTMVMVMAEDEVLYDEVLETGAPDVVRALATALRQVAREVGGFPKRLLVRDPAVAVRLTAEFARQGVDVRASDAVEAVARSIRSVAGSHDLPELFWDLHSLEERSWRRVAPEPAAALFRAAARFWRARPWEWVREPDALMMTCEGSNSVIVLHPPLGHGHVFTLFTRAADFPGGMDSAKEPVLGVRFTGPFEFPSVLRGRLASGGWEVATVDAYPTVLTDRDLGETRFAGSIAAHLTRALDAAAALAESRASLAPGASFTDGATGVRLRMDAAWQGVPWAPVGTLRPGGAEGSGAAPAAALAPPDADAARRDAARLERFVAHLRAGGTGERTARQHRENAAGWFHFLGHAARVPAAAATEYDLRIFLYDWYPRLGSGTETGARALPAALRALFTWQAEEEGIAYPWAAAVLRERAIYRDRLETAPLGSADGPRDTWFEREVRAWQGVLHRDLDARVMLHDHGFPAGFQAGTSTHSPPVAALAHELQRRWQLWRDEEVRGGITDAAELRAALLLRQREWERTTHPAHGASPLRVVALAGEEPAP